MNQNQNKVFSNSEKYRLIYNPNAGKKRSFWHMKSHSNATLEEVEFLLSKYQIPVDLSPTKRAGHATELAAEAISMNYKGVLVAGGDGTVGEAANGLINTDLPLGILPLGSFMNIARMLSVPTELEKAVAIIKIGRTRKIDVGKITRMGDKLEKPYFFLESSSMGLEAQIHESLRELENGKISEIFKFIKTFFDFYTYKVDLVIDGEAIHTRASAVVIANGAVSGAALKLAPKAKLNDHLLTVTIYKMTKYELIRVLMNLLRGKRSQTYKIKTHQAKTVTLKTRNPSLVHADARVFGETPAEYLVVPNALNVIAGFPEPGEDFLKAKTVLDP